MQSEFCKPKRKRCPLIHQNERDSELPLIASTNRKICPKRRENMTRIGTPNLIGVDNGAHDSGRNDLGTIALAALIILCFINWLAIEIPKGILTDTDELLTAERSLELPLATPSAIHFNFQ